MSLRHLATLIAIAEHGSFAAAAERLGLTQSAVSMQMKALEGELDAELFDRSRRPPELSGAGRAAIEPARRILALYAGLREAARTPGDLAGSLRIGVIPTASTGLLPAALALLSGRYPRLAIRIENGLSTELALRVADGALDAAVVTGDSGPERGLSRHLILTERLMVVAPLGAAGSTDATLLTGLPFIRFNRRAGVGRIIERALGSRRIRVAEAMELDSIEAILAMVSRGLGVSVVPEHALTDDLRRALVCMPFGDPPATRSVTLVARAGGLAPRTEALLRSLREVAERPAP